MKTMPLSRKELSSNPISPAAQLEKRGGFFHSCNLAVDSRRFLASLVCLSVFCSDLSCIFYFPVNLICLRFHIAPPRLEVESRTRLHVTDKAFSIAGPRAWNALPSDIKIISIINKNQLPQEAQDTLFSRIQSKLLLVFQHVTFSFYVYACTVRGR